MHDDGAAVPVDRRTWTVVVPVKDARRGKTRLSAVLAPGQRAELVRAMALDTVEAALACERVARVLVVTEDTAVAAGAHRLDRVAVVGEPPHQGRRSDLDAAVRAGVAAARLNGPAPVAVLLGDVPGLRPADLAAALGAADAVDRGVVADVPGTGTTMLTVGPDIGLEPRFGAGSAAAHRALGHQPLDVPTASTVRRDVDVPADLRAAADLTLGRRTAAVIEGLRGVL